METQETYNQTKKCTRCGRELPLSEFGIATKSKDGHNWACKECIRKANKESRLRVKIEKAKIMDATPPNLYDRNMSGGGNPALANFTARQLMEELRARGYRGTLEYTSRINIEKI